MPRSSSQPNEDGEFDDPPLLEGRYTLFIQNYLSVLPFSDLDIDIEKIKQKFLAILT